MSIRDLIWGIKTAGATFERRLSENPESLNLLERSMLI
jgi:hypothetical protein